MKVLDIHQLRGRPLAAA